MADLPASGIVFVCVGTPSTASGDADLSAVWQVLDELPPGGDGLLLVMKSTVPVGTGARVRQRLDERRLEHVGYVSNPEFLAEGTGLDNFARPDRVVVGAGVEAQGDRVTALFEPLGVPVVRTDVASAEMIKLASNAALMTRVSFINEIANVCELVGADVEKVALGVGLDHRIGPHFLRAGIGYGGSCFPKDASALKQLAANSGYHFQLLSAVIDVNELQKRRVVQKLQARLGSLGGKVVTLLGLAFKANTNDLREAPSLVLAPRLAAEGAVVRAWDPVALEEARAILDGVELHETVLEAVTGADAAVIVTEWPELRDLASPEVLAVMRTPLIVDGRNLLDPTAARAAGFEYESVGRPSAPARES
jgi:UDPglucose 6-dehydrogenase